MRFRNLYIENIICIPQEKVKSVVNLLLIRKKLEMMKLPMTIVDKRGRMAVHKAVYFVQGNQST